MHVTLTRAAGVLLTALLAAPLMAAAQTAPAQSAERTRTQGLRETDRFVKAGNNAHASIANARRETKHTLDMYNKLVTQPSKNMKGDYKKLLGAVDDMKEEVADARLEITNMRASGDTYFTGRETTNKAIQDPQLQSSAWPPAGRTSTTSSRRCARRGMPSRCFGRISPTRSRSWAAT
jgi:hypothetical protein